MSRLLLSGLLIWALGFNCESRGGVEVEINGETPTDDYLTWTPVVGRARVTGVTADLNVVLSSSVRGAGNQGEVHFQAKGAANPTSTTFAPVTNLSLTLPASGAWQEFWIAGKLSSAGDLLPNGAAATKGKDTLVIVKDAAGTTVLEHPVMVRVRKDAETLTDGEVSRFLKAVAELHDVPHIGTPTHNSRYVKYVKVHGDAFFSGIHGVPAFSSWHRTMLLSFERELQSIDPSVALPYWKYDAVAPKLFTERFIGRVNGGSPFVAFDSQNPMEPHPLTGWRMPSNAAIANWQVGDPPPPSTQLMVRNGNGDNTIPPVNPGTVHSSPNYSLMNNRLESGYHNDAHNHIGGWMGDLTSPKDPLFFLLHCNVDRAWAWWQHDKKMNDRTNPQHYFPQGTFAAGAGSHQGSFVGDTQWPWNGAGGDQGTVTPDDDWPEFIFDLPAGFVNHGPSAIPITGETVDYQNSLGTGLPLNVAYDSIPYQP